MQLEGVKQEYENESPHRKKGDNRKTVPPFEQQNPIKYEEQEFPGSVF